MSKQVFRHFENVPGPIYPLGFLNDLIPLSLLKVAGPGDILGSLLCIYLHLFQIKRDLRCQKRFKILGFSSTSIKPLP